MIAPHRLTLGVAIFSACLALISVCAEAASVRAPEPAPRTAAKPLVIDVKSLVQLVTEAERDTHAAPVTELTRRINEARNKLEKLRPDDPKRPAAEAELHALKMRLEEANRALSDFRQRVSTRTHRREQIEKVLGFVEGYRETHGYTDVYDVSGIADLPAPPAGLKAKPRTSEVFKSWEKGTYSVLMPGATAKETSEYRETTRVHLAARSAEEAYQTMAAAVTPEGIDGKIRPIKVAPPVYPERAARQRIEGVVEIEFVVDQAGAVRDARVARSAHPLLDEAALKAVRQWRFEPMTANGEPVAVRMLQRIPFVFPK